MDFLKRILVWDAESRMTPLEALQHPWIVEGLPRKVLIHHQRMLGLDVPSDESEAECDAEVSQSRMQGYESQTDSIRRPDNQPAGLAAEEPEDNYG